MPDAKSELTVGEVITEYLVNRVAQFRAGLITKGAVAHAHLYCCRFSEEFGHLQLSQCRRGDLKRWLCNHPEWRSPHTKQDAAGTVVTAFRWAADDGLIAVCPYSRPRDLPVPQPRKPITHEEVRRILASAHGYGHRPTRKRFRLAVWFLWETGCRTCEMRGLRWEWFDAARGCFEFPSKSTGKTGRNRLIALTRRALRFVRWLRFQATVAKAVAAGLPAAGMRADKTLVANPPTGNVFLNGRGRPWGKDTFGKLFRRHANAAGVRKEISAYCMRHGFCCELLEAGQGERQIADLMGHSSTKYISWYGRGVKAKVDYLRDVGEARRRKK